MKRHFLFVLLILAGFFAKAQNVLVDSTSASDSLPKKPYRVYFNLDIGLKGLKAIEHTFYAGEYYAFTGGTPAQTWEWREVDSIRSNYLDDHKFRAIRLEMLMAVYKELKVGFSYNGIIINTPRNAVVSSFVPFFAMAGVVSYDHPIKKVPGLYVGGNLSLGTYQSNEVYQGIGRELFTEARFTTSYVYKEKIGMRLWTAANYTSYEEKLDSQSNEFLGKVNHYKLDWKLWHMGMGFIYRINFVPN